MLIETKEKTFAAQKGKTIEISSGMTATVEIITGDNNWLLYSSVTRHSV